MVTNSHTSKPPATTKTWLITGAGKGLGRAFAEAAVSAGHHVVGTVRTPGALGELVADHPDSVHEIVLNLSDTASIPEAVDHAAGAFGGIDVVVNNAGTGFVGAIEEVTEAEVRAHLDLNLLGAMWVSRAAIPHLRSSGGGDIVQISTVGAIGAMPMFGLYNAGKWALEGFSEALAAEVDQFGIHVTIAQLGGFNTDWAGSSMPFAHPLPVYDDLRTATFGTAQVPGPHTDEASQDGDPRQAAHALLAHLSGTARPLRVLIGQDAPGLANLAYAARRDSYGAQTSLEWPEPIC
jgi:NAD(P)-dependent dehydrogenase (short-subunit alcohol dehydrogenase family)